MSKEGSIKESEKANGTKFKSFCQFIWNTDTKEFLGRNGSSWAKVGVFYTVFYVCLGLFWFGMLRIFLTTISDERPKWILDESLIGLNPGLGFRPNERIDKVDSTLIHFRPYQNASYAHWVKDLDNYLKTYRDEYYRRSDCRSFPSRSGCPFLPDLANHPCGQNYGFDTGSPCILIKLNRVYNWKPSPYRSLDDIRNGLKNNENKMIQFEPKIKNQNDLTSGEGQITIQCEGENASDKENLGGIDYWPRQGFPVEYYPYTNQKGYLSPFALVKFNKPSTGLVINIECIAMDRKITVDRYDREGAVGFKLLIDN